MSGEFDPYHRWLGIPAKDQPANHYRLLGIQQFESDPEVIRDAAEQRIAHVRTYQLGQFLALSQTILNELATAKACLLNPQAKATYDGQLSKAAAPGGEVEERKETASSPPLIPQASLASASSEPPAAPTRPRWLLPTAIGGGVLLVIVAIVALVLTKDRGDEGPGNEIPTPVEKKPPSKVKPPPEPITVSVEFPSVPVKEGETAGNRVRCNRKVTDAVRFSATCGKATCGKVEWDDESHAWRWLYVPIGPEEKRTVKISASDTDGEPATTTFELEVENVPPTISADRREVTVDERGGASNTGRYSHPGECPVEIRPSCGDVTKDAAAKTWSWSYQHQPSDGPLPKEVRITVDDGYDSAPTTFVLVSRPPKPPDDKPPPVSPIRLPPEGLRLPAGISPGGNRLTQEMLEAPKDWQAGFFSDINRRFIPLAYVVNHADKTVEAYSYYPLPPKPAVVGIVTCKWADPRAKGALRQGNGKLHGYAAELDNQQQLRVLARYAMGQLDGQVKLWDAQDVQLYYGEYRAGKKHGLTCFFQKGTLKLIRQYSFGQVRQEYVVRWTAAGVPSVAGNLSRDEERERNEMVEQLKELESKIKSNETKLREEVMNNVRTATGKGGTPLDRPQPPNRNNQPGGRGSPLDRPVNPNPNNRSPNGMRLMPGR
jgi:hypothetical protein